MMRSKTLRTCGRKIGQRGTDMASIHVLTGGSPNFYTVIVHVPTPAGNNSAGLPWVEVIKSSGRNRTTMTVGPGPGQISESERTQIIQGTVLEGLFQWEDTPAWTTPERIADLDAKATQLASDLLAQYGQDLKYFGF